MLSDTLQVWGCAPTGMLEFWNIEIIPCGFPTWMATKITMFAKVVEIPKHIATAQTLCLRFIVPWHLLFDCGTAGFRPGRKNRRYCELRRGCWN